MSDIEKIKQLRQSTGAGFKDCNTAIEEAAGDLDKAVEILRVKGISKAAKKMSRNAPGSRISSNLRTLDHLGRIPGPEKFRFVFGPKSRYSSVFRGFSSSGTLPE